MASNPYVNKVDLANGTTLIDLSQDTATQADVAQGKYFHLPTGERVQGTASGGGGTGGIYQDQDGYLVLSPDGGGGGGGANIVTGTFTGTTTGQAVDIPLSYSGNGYPVAVFVKTEDDDFDSLVERYALKQVAITKEDWDTAPDYTTSGATNNVAIYARENKNSTSAADSYTYAVHLPTTVFANSDATSSNSGCVKIKSKTTLSVYIKDPASGYGFASGIEYKYYVVYSE